MRTRIAPRTAEAEGWLDEGMGTPWSRIGARRTLRAAWSRFGPWTTRSRLRFPVWCLTVGSVPRVRTVGSQSPTVDGGSGCSGRGSSPSDAMCCRAPCRGPFRPRRTDRPGWDRRFEKRPRSHQWTPRPIGVRGRPVEAGAGAGRRKGIRPYAEEPRLPGEREARPGRGVPRVPDPEPEARCPRTRAPWRRCRSDSSPRRRDHSGRARRS